MLHAVPDRIRLQQLGAVNELVKILRHLICLGHIVHHFAVSGRAALVHLHDAGEDIPVARFREGADCRHAREGLEAELGEEPVVMMPVRRERLIAVPDAPIVGISHVLLVGVLKIPAARRRTRPVEGARILLRDQLREDVLIHFDIVVALLLARMPGVVLRLRLQLIVAAPEPDARMVAQPPHIVPDLRRDVLLKRVVQLIRCTGEQHILPDKQSCPVALIVKIIIEKISAAPDADAVHMRHSGRLDQLRRAFRRHPRDQIVLRNIISTHGEDRHAVHREGKIPAFLSVLHFLLLQVRIPLLIRNQIGVHSHRAKADLTAPRVKLLPGRRIHKTHQRMVQWLPAVSVRPPQLRILHRDLRGQSVHPALIKEHLLRCGSRIQRR